MKGQKKSRSQMPVWTVSQRFSHLQWRRLFKESWCRPTTTADFGSSLCQSSPTPATFSCWKIRFKTEVVLVLNFLRRLGAFYSGQFRLRPSSFFYSGQFYLGQVQLRPISVCPFDHPKCQDEKKDKMKKKKKRKRKRNERAGQSI